jgi:signal transduction histidine kinase
LTSKTRGAETSAAQQSPGSKGNTTGDDRGRLLTEIAHEVRNPLFSISATADAIETRISGSDPVLRQHLTNLRQEIARLNALMVGLVEYGRPPKLVAQAGSLTELLSRAVQRVQKQATERGLQIITEIPPHECLVSLDPERLMGALETVLQNAISCSPAGETVHLRLVTPDVDPPQVWIEVEDRGTCVRPEELSRLFEPFFLRRLGGTGLSLPCARQVIELHGGEITVRNRSGGGLSMKITLPTYTGD